MTTTSHHLARTSKSLLSGPAQLYRPSMLLMTMKRQKQPRQQQQSNNRLCIRYMPLLVVVVVMAAVTPAKVVFGRPGSGGEVTEANEHQHYQRSQQQQQRKFIYSIRTLYNITNERLSIIHQFAYFIYYNNLCSDQYYDRQEHQQHIMNAAVPTNRHQHHTEAAAAEAVSDDDETDELLRSRRQLIPDLIEGGRRVLGDIFDPWNRRRYYRRRRPAASGGAVFVPSPPRRSSSSLYWGFDSGYPSSMYSAYSPYYYGGVVDAADPHQQHTPVMDIDADDSSYGAAAGYDYAATEHDHGDFGEPSYYSYSDDAADGDFEY